MRYTDHIHAGARAILINKEPRIYRIVELIANKVNLTEDGLFFAVKDIKTGELIGAKFDDLRFGSRKRDKENEDYYTIDEWIDTQVEGHISDYDGGAYFCDDEYVYYYPDPFNPFYFKNDAVNCFSGVIFYGK